MTTLAILRHSIRPARTRRAAWVMVCLWLLVALVPVVALDGAALAAAAAPPAAMSGAAPEGALKALFRPPRG